MHAQRARLQKLQKALKEALEELQMFKEQAVAQQKALKASQKEATAAWEALRLHEEKVEDTDQTATGASFEAHETAQAASSKYQRALDDAASCRIAVVAEFNRVKDDASSCRKALDEQIAQHAVEVQCLHASIEAKEKAYHELLKHNAKHRWWVMCGKGTTFFVTSIGVVLPLVGFALFKWSSHTGPPYSRLA